ncbi:50S ribosomal protein L29 [Armatimonadota bacterium]|nr:50S ribosomal protein L29 [Armatimonadota bacterium]GDX40940.1 50S ribosomal protein L29 [Armatimonadota bacterium]
MANLKLSEVRKQLRNMSDEELVNEVSAQRANLYHMRRKSAMRQLENTADIHTARKQIARALTILRERELSAQKEGK